MMMYRLGYKVFQRAVLLTVLIPATGCYSSLGDQLNPYYEPGPSSEYGVRDTKAILGDGGSAADDRARHSLEVLGSYQREREPQPYKPVVLPREVRLMWVPDHLNKGGDLVPAHYYYLRVLNDRWNVTDAFDIDEQLNQGSSSAVSSVPYILK